MTKNLMEKMALPLTGFVIAAVSVALVVCGNPGNMGLCVACFLRDTAGALGLHGAANLQYARPEVIGLLLGSLVVSLVRREFSSKGGSAPITRFVLGACVMVGALIFLGCPTRMLLRIAGGDLNAVVGLIGFAGGVFAGMFFLKKGFTLKRTYELTKTEGFVLPAASVVLLVVLVFFPVLLNFSQSGPGSMHAPIWLALLAGLVVGGLGFLTRFCFVAGIRDSVFFKKFGMLSGFVVLIVTAVIGNIIFGQFNLGFENQPVAHTDGLWNFLGMSLVGLGSVMLGGCPFRQVIRAGSGDSDGVAAIFGMMFGAALAHNLSLASTAAGVSERGPVALGFAAVVMVAIACFNTFNKKSK